MPGAHIYPNTLRFETSSGTISAGSFRIAGLEHLARWYYFDGVTRLKYILAK